MKKILFVSDSIKRKTGYATVARNLMSRLLTTGKYEIAQLGLADIPTPVDLPINYYTQIKKHDKCCKKGAVIEYRSKDDTTIKFLTNDIENWMHKDQQQCIKGINDQRDNYAYDSVYYVIQHFQPDIVTSINDIWGLYNINHIRNRSCFKFIPYLAIDSECMFPGLDVPNGRPGMPNLETVGTIKKCDKVIVFTDWAQKVINKTFQTIKRRNYEGIMTIPHGVDTKIWRPLENKTELRKKYFNISNPEKIFLIGSIARNQPRKRLDAAIMTLKKFIDNYEKPGKKAMLYFHCSIEDQMGWPIQWIANYYGVLDRCIFDQNLKPGMGPTDEQLNELTNCLDVHLSLTNSEGWNLPALETSAAGIPNVITNYSAHADWGKDALCFCKVAEYEHEPRTGFIKAIADTKDAAKQLGLLYNSKQFYNDYSKKGIALGKKLDWDNIVEKWDKYFDTVDISDLKENRYKHPMVRPQSNDPNDMTLTTFPASNK